MVSFAVGYYCDGSGVDSRPPERSVCDVDAVVCENLSVSPVVAGVSSLRTPCKPDRLCWCRDF